MGERRNRDDPRLCRALTDGVKMPRGRIWLRPPRACGQWALRGYQHCAHHLSVEERDRYNQQLLERRRARAAGGAEGEQG